MTTSTDRDEGTSNSERIAAEARRAAEDLEDRGKDYRTLVAQAAVECYLLTAEHDEQRININQQYDEVITGLAAELVQAPTESAES